MKQIALSQFFAVFHLGMRGLALAARFCLSVFMVKYLDLKAVGFFGLMVGIMSIVPPSIGFGLSFFVVREIIGQPYLEAGRRIRDWLVATASFLILGYIIVLGAMKGGLIPVPTDLTIVLLIIFFETIGFYVYIALMALKMPLLANTFIFVKTASWVPIFIATAYFLPQFRTLSFMMELWCGALVMSYVILAWHLRFWPWEAIFKTRVDWRRLKGHLIAAPLVYLSDIGIVGSTFLNRFILGAMTNLEQTGVFVFFWTLANAVSVLVSNSTVQVAEPHLVESYRRHGNKIFLNDLKRVALHVGGLALALSILVFGGVSWVVTFIGRQELLGHTGLFILIFIATNLQLFSEVVTRGLYARRQDKAFAWTNILGVIFNATTTIVFIYLFGLYGAGYAMIVAALFTLGCGLYFLFDFRTDQTGQPKKFNKFLANDNDLLK